MTENEKRTTKEEDFNWNMINFAADPSARPAAYVHTDEARFSVSKDLIIRAVEQRDRAELIKYSNYFYRASNIYSRLVDYMANLLTFAHVIYPLPESSADDVDKANEEYFNRFSLHGLSREIALNVVKDGIFVACEWELDDAIVFQTLPSEFCRIKARGASGYTAEFNFAFFDQFEDEERPLILEQFPEYFSSLYSTYESDNELMWQLLDSETTIACMLNNILPLFSSSLIDLIDVEEAKKMDRVDANQSLTRILIQRPPLNKETNKPTIPAKELTVLHQNLRRTAQAKNIDVITSPCDISALDLQSGYQGKDDKTYAEKALTAVYSTAGVPAILFVGESISGAALEESIKIDAALMLGLLDQIQTWFNSRLEILNYPVRVIFPPATIQNHVSLAKEFDLFAKNGYPTKLLALACMNIDTTAAKGLATLEESIEWGETSDASNYDPSNPRAKKDKVGDEGEKTREGEKNDK